MQQYKSIVINQSNYIPWRGFFDMIHSVDAYVILDTVQFTRQDWRNRNMIKTPSGPLWLSIPVNQKGRLDKMICEITTSNDIWKRKHLGSIKQFYNQAPCFKEFYPILSDLYDSCNSRYLSEINLHFLKGICNYLDIHTKIVSSEGISVSSEKNQRVIDICRHYGAKNYLTGDRAKNYIRYELFDDAGIKLAFYDNSNYKPYPQLHGNFINNLSIIDTLLNCGKESTKFMKTF